MRARLFIAIALPQSAAIRYREIANSASAATPCPFSSPEPGFVIAVALPLPADRRHDQSTATPGPRAPNATAQEQSEIGHGSVMARLGARLNPARGFFKNLLQPAKPGGLCHPHRSQARFPKAKAEALQTAPGPNAVASMPRAE